MKKLTAYLAAALVAGALTVAGPANAEQLAKPFTATKVVDLTHEMHPGMAFWPGGVPFSMKRLVDYDKGYRLHSFTMGENTGTHVDAPGHFIKGNKAINQLSLASLVVPAAVIDVKAKVAKNADYEATADDVLAWEKAHGKVPAGSLVILNTGWHKRFATPKRYVNMDAGKIMHFPGYHPSAARLLVERDVAGIAIDTLSLDFGGSKTFATHVVMLKANKYQIENLANLDALPATGATVVVGVLPVRNGTQAQARIIAFLP